jgi:cobalamin biosynthesis protein CbiD
MGVDEKRYSELFSGGVPAARGTAAAAAARAATTMLGRRTHQMMDFSKLDVHTLSGLPTIELAVSPLTPEASTVTGTLR